MIIKENENNFYKLKKAEQKDHEKKRETRPKRWHNPKKYDNNFTDKDLRVVKFDKVKEAVFDKK